MKSKPAKVNVHSLYNVIIYPSAVAVFIIALFGSTFFSSLIIKETEKQEHSRVEQAELAGVRLFSSQLLSKGFEKNNLADLKNILNATAVSIYTKDGLVSSSLDSNDSLRSAIPFEPAFMEELAKKAVEKKEEIPHLHKHFTPPAGGQSPTYMSSFYFFDRQENFPFLLAFTSEIPNLYEFRNRISSIVTLTISLVIGSLALFFILIVRKYIMKPTRKFTELVIEVGKGNLKISQPISAYGEMAELSKNFSIMVERLREIREKEQAVNKLKSEILSIAAHNLRSPLTALKWGLRMILDGELGEIISPEQKRMLTNIYESNDNMIVLINDLLDVGRIEEGQFNYVWSYNFLEKVIDAVMESSGSKIRRSDLKIIYHRPKKPLPKIKMDFQKLITAVGNLLDNSLRYTQKGEVEIYIFYQKFPSSVVFEIKDTGIGVPKIEQKKLFSKFFRASNVLAKDIKGTGLGLFIVKEIVEKHGGRIWFKPRKEGGSVFGFSLPAEERFAPKEEYLEFLENI